MVDVKVVCTLDTEESTYQTIESTAVPFQQVHVNTHTVGVHIHKVVTACAIPGAILRVAVVLCQRHIYIQVTEANSVYIQRNRSILACLRSTTQHEVAGVDSVTCLCHTAEQQLSLALTGSQVGRIGFQGEALIERNVAGNVISLATFQIEALVFGQCVRSTIFVKDVIELHRVI